MWLLDVKSARLVSFANQEEIPPYAILSHTWTNEEVSFQDIMSMDTGTNLTNKTGWSKINGACNLTSSFGLSYVWIDTCCIDKSSSAELQEAINSMFKWYELAEICFAYLVDVSVQQDIRVQGSSFRQCRWFKRGWTLQELLAPIEVAFYYQDWKPISTRAQTRDLIESITGIRQLYLSRPTPGQRIYDKLSSASVAERMSWMDKRETTRPEDLAYCLLGIFEINMPMLYGEGSKAFQRLQEQIMKRSDDCTLLSWGYQELCSNWRWEQASLLAPHPSSFRNCKDIEPCSMEGFNAASFSMNQRGLQMKVPICFDSTHQLLAYMILNCSPRSETECFPEKGAPKSFVAIPLISTSAYDEFEMG
ncbi:DENN domain-containing protein [Fusarium oxysporum f. sp. albedinis]|nr:DENN domain-containing protein [Fusarium oxysporum f. sp. albedinis]